MKSLKKLGIFTSAIAIVGLFSLSIFKEVKAEELEDDKILEIIRVYKAVDPMTHKVKCPLGSELCNF